MSYIKLTSFLLGASYVHEEEQRQLPIRCYIATCRHSSESPACEEGKQKEHLVILQTLTGFTGCSSAQGCIDLLREALSPTCEPVHDGRINCSFAYCVHCHTELSMAAFKCKKVILCMVYKQLLTSNCECSVHVWETFLLCLH